MGVLTAALVVGGITAATKITQAQMEKNRARDEMKSQAQKAADAKAAMSELERNRQEVINPYGDMANEFENIGVSTQASEFEAEEADIALANTLDTIMATGGGAGGATALAQAALQSKRGISASIQKQEQANNEARAQGANQVSQLKAQGEAFKFNAQESRDDAKLNQLQVDKDNAEGLERQAQQAKAAANAQIVSATGQFASSAVTSGLVPGLGPGGTGIPIGSAG